MGKNVPYKRFEKFCWKLDADLKADKKTLKRIFRKKEFVVKADDELKKLYPEVQEMSKDANISENNLKLLLLEMIAKAQFKEEQEAKKQKEREKEKERQREREKEREKKRAKREKDKKKDSSRKEDKEKKKKKRK